MKSLIFIVSIALLSALVNCDYTKLQWSDCGSKEVTVYTVDITPMPILQPGIAYLTLLANLKRPLSGNLKTDLNIVRTVAGIALPIRCYIAGGVSVGSCSYNDLCTVIKTLFGSGFSPAACPPELLPFGIDCTCPFKIRGGDIDIVRTQLDLPDASTTVATFLANGDFDITIKTADAVGSFACVNIKFTVKKR